MSTNTAPVMVAPTSLIDVIYSADSVANKSLALVLAEKPVAVPLALSTTLDSPGGVGLGGTAKANPPVLEEAKEGKLVSALLSLVLPAKAVVGSSSL